MTFEEWMKSYGQHFEQEAVAQAAWSAGYWEGFGTGYDSGFLVGVGKGRTPKMDDLMHKINGSSRFDFEQVASDVADAHHKALNTPTSDEQGGGNTHGA